MTTNHSKNPQPSPKYKTKERVSLTLDYKIYNQFRKVSDKYMQPKSAIVENAIHRYVQSKIWETDIL